MAMVDVDGSSHLWRLAAQVGGLGMRVGVHQAFSLHSSNELGELSQWCAMMTAP